MCNRQQMRNPGADRFFAPITVSRSPTQFPWAFEAQEQPAGTAPILQRSWTRDSHTASVRRVTSCPDHVSARVRRCALPGVRQAGSACASKGMGRRLAGLRGTSGVGGSTMAGGGAKRTPRRSPTASTPRAATPRRAEETIRASPLCRRTRWRCGREVQTLLSKGFCGERAQRRDDARPRSEPPIGGTSRRQGAREALRSLRQSRKAAADQLST